MDVWELRKRLRDDAEADDIVEICSPDGTDLGYVVGTRIRTGPNGTGALLLIVEPVKGHWPERDSLGQEKTNGTNNAVNHPSYYNLGIECIEVIRSLGWWREFCLGNVLKYVMRAGEKDPQKELEDLQKASWYLNYVIERLQEGRGVS